MPARELQQLARHRRIRGWGTLNPTLWHNMRLKDASQWAAQEFIMIIQMWKSRKRNITMMIDEMQHGNIVVIRRPGGGRGGGGLLAFSLLLEMRTIGISC